MWPLISGQNATSPRVELPLSNNTYINGDYKLIVHGVFPSAGWTGPQYPNASSPAHDPSLVTLDCKMGCLFNVENDPVESNNLAASTPSLLAYMKRRLAYWTTTYYNNDETGTNSCPASVTEQCACWMAMNHWGGFFGPYQELP